MNLFRSGKPDGSLDMEYLRICAVYRLLDRRMVDKTLAIELLADRHVTQPTRLVELWMNGPLSDKGRANRVKFRQMVAA